MIVLEQLRLLFDFGLVVLIWMVQLIVYPSFKKYSKKDLIVWHKIYVKRIAVIVGPLMIGQLLIATWQLYLVKSPYTILVFIFILFLWGFTFTHFAPLHQRISNASFTLANLAQLERRNWMRTVLWTLIFLWGLAEAVSYPML